MNKQTVSFHQVDALTEVLPVKNKRKKVGILGGTFNPPHIGHLIIADQVCQQLGLDKIYFMPSANPPHQDEKKAIAASHRVKMVEAAIQDNPLFDIEKSEVERGGKSYTYDTLLQLVKEHPETDYYFIIGGDMVAYLPRWYRIEELLHLVQFVGVNRPGYGLESPYPIIWVDVPSLDISSTLLRTKLETNCPVRYLIPDKTLQYISEKGLYQHADKTE